MLPLVSILNISADRSAKHVSDKLDAKYYQLRDNKDNLEDWVSISSMICHVLTLTLNFLAPWCIDSSSLRAGSLSVHGLGCFCPETLVERTFKFTWIWVVDHLTAERGRITVSIIFWTLYRSISRVELWSTASRPFQSSLSHRLWIECKIISPYCVTAAIKCRTCWLELVKVLRRWNWHILMDTFLESNSLTSCCILFWGAKELTIVLRVLGKEVHWSGEYKYIGRR